MAYKKTDKCCRYCVYRGWGKTSTKQQCDDRMVCFKKPKRFKSQDHNMNYYHAIISMAGCCENFKRRD